MLLSFTLLLSSCFSYKDITKTEPITQEFLARLKPGKTYEFTLKTGQEIKVHVKTVSEERITGYIFQSGDILPSAVKDNYYSETFGNLEKNIAKISLREHHPFSTILVTMFSVATVAMIAGLISWGSY